LLSLVWKAARFLKHARNSQSVSQSSWAYMGCVHSGGVFLLRVFLFMALWFLFCRVGVFFVSGWISLGVRFSLWPAALARVFRVEACDN